MLFFGTRRFPADGGFNDANAWTSLGETSFRFSCNATGLLDTVAGDAGVLERPRAANPRSYLTPGRRRGQRGVYAGQGEARYVRGRRGSLHIAAGRRRAAVPAAQVPRMIAGYTWLARRRSGNSPHPGVGDPLDFSHRRCTADAEANAARHAHTARTPRACARCAHLPQVPSSTSTKARPSSASCGAVASRASASRYASNAASEYTDAAACAAANTAARAARPPIAGGGAAAAGLRGRWPARPPMEKYLKNNCNLLCCVVIILLCYKLLLRLIGMV